MSDTPNIQKIREAEAAIEEFIATEAEMREAFMEDGLDREEKEQLDAILKKIEALKASVVKLRKDLERNKAKWEKMAKRFDAYKDKATKMLDFDDALAEKAVRLQVDIEEAVVSERWADAAMIFETAEEEIKPDWEEYERQSEAFETYEPLLKNFRDRRDAALQTEGLTEDQEAKLVALDLREKDIEAALAKRDYHRTRELTLAAIEALEVVETALGTAPAANLSGAKWYRANEASYPNSKDIGDLESAFKAKVTAFKTALEAAGVGIEINSTLRDTKRAAIMHYSWRVGFGEITGGQVPAIAGVDINFDHGADDLSKVKALEMVKLFHLAHKPSLTSNHTTGKAIDWDLEWTGTLTIENKAGEEVEITSTPKNGTNSDLHPVGASYGVHKLVGDPPHWSHNGG